MTNRKSYFSSKTKTQIVKGSLVGLARLTDIFNLSADQYVIINPLLPNEYDSARKFMKHGPEVRPRRYYTLDQAIRDGRTPVQLREEAFNAISDPFYCGYSILPTSRDRRKRKISLIECVEGARIFAYSHQVPGTSLDVKAYSDCDRVFSEGAEVVSRVPSRTRKEKRHELKLVSVPFKDSSEKYLISQNIGSDHSCGSKRFNIRYRYTDDKESSGIVNLCAHEVAAYLQLVQQEWENNKNIIPLQMSPFAIPSQETARYYLNLENNVLVKDPTLVGKDKLRKMNRAEKEIALWAFVKRYGHDRTFFAKPSRDGNVRDYNWNIE